MKKILLINPRKGWRPALGILYVASYLRQAGHLVKIIEFIDEKFFPDANKKIWQELHSFNPDIIGLGVISWNRLVAKAIIEKIKKSTINKIIICGGKDPTFSPETYLHYGVDYVVIHEGEITTKELIDTIENQQSVDGVGGICYLKNGKVITNPRREQISIEKLPFPAFDLIDYDKYCNIRLGGVPGHFIRTGYIMANRGCPYKCRFCTDPVRSVYRERSVDNIIEEIKWQVKNWKMDGIVFLDDLFYYREDRVEEFCNKVISQGIKLKFYAQARVDRIKEKIALLPLMKKAGFIQLAFGLESGSPRMLEIMNKKITLEQIENAIKRINNAGIYSYAFLIVGFPEEKIEDLELTAKFLEKVKPTFVTVNYFMPMPGTDYYKETDGNSHFELSYSLTENQNKFMSTVSNEDLLSFRNKFLSLAQKSADRNLFKYPSFYIWIVSLLIFRSKVIIKGIQLQRKNRTYTSYFEAIRTSMINDRIYGNYFREIY